MRTMNPEITTVRGKLPGRTVAVFAGIHGNEPAGVLAVTKLIGALRIDAGTVHFVIANPKAVEQNVRFTEKNLNRCFINGNTGAVYEDGLARELMKLLDGCDALLDLHGYNGPEDRPFLICEKESFDLACKFNFEIISSGWSVSEPGGTDGYMHAQNKIAICAECGSNFYPEKYIGLAEKTILQFLGYFGIIASLPEDTLRSRLHINVDRFIKKTSSRFAFDKEYQNFDKLETGKIFATDGEIKYVAREGEYIIFHRPNTEIGQEACVIGRLIK